MHYVSAVDVGPKGRVWVLSTRAVAWLQDGKFVTRALPEGLAQVTDVHDPMCVGQDDRLWVGAGDAVACFDGRT